MNQPWILPLQQCVDAALIGGKAVNLGQLLRAGFPVPGGFVVTTSAFLHARSGDNAPTPALAEQIADHYTRLGSPTVAVRSSATAEDLKGASMAGQYETLLGINGVDELISAVRRCWASIDTPRTKAYLADKGIDLSQVAMAVVVQRLVHADVAGVAFTVNPRTGRDDQMLIEASWGLGESVVSGEVQPDTLTLARRDGRVIDANIAEKESFLDPATKRQMPVPTGDRRKPCLSSKHVHALWQLMQQVEAHFDHPQDLEWAIASDELFLLQSRAVTTLQPLQDRLRAIDGLRASVRELIAAGRGPWVPHNISETLPHPTPFTWGVIRQFLSGDGGFGAMYRAAGFEPSAKVATEGFVDLLAGRIYMDLARGPEMFFADFPFAYDAELLRHNPEAGQSPPTLPCGTVGQRMSINSKLAGVNATIDRLSTDFDQSLQRRIIPEFVQWVKQQQAIDLGALTTEAFIELWEAWRSQVMDSFAPDSLLPSLIVGQLQAQLQTLLAEQVWDQDATALSRELAAGAAADKTVQANAALFAVADGKRSLTDWLTEFGHRAPGELDLAVPRWRERPADLQRLADQLKGGADPAARHHQQHAASQAAEQRVRALLPAAQRAEFDRLLDRVRRYTPFREDGKFYLMLGYSLLRDWALEAGRRLEIGDGVFYLSPDEVQQSLRSTYAPLEAIAQRRRQHAAMAKLELPHLIDAASVDTLGEPAALVGSDRWSGFSISAGQGRGPAVIVHDPAAAPALSPGYVLVCRTTDPSWTPLFINAAGVVLETGGSLSHGAIVARELGVPAVVVPGATRLIQAGQMIHVDGDRGAVSLADAAPSTATIEDAADTRIEARLLPPPPGPKDRSAAKLRNGTAIGWVVFLIAAFLLPPAWLYEPTMALLDALLWPIMRAVGPVWGTAIIAAGIAAATMLLQRMLTDNRRLREAKRRSAALQKQAIQLPLRSPRRLALTTAGAGLQSRMFGAAMVPIGLLLGPLTLIFLWLPARVDPAVLPPPAGARFLIKATVDADYALPITLIPGDTRLISGSAAEQTVPPIRTALRSIRAILNRSPANQEQLPWQLAMADKQIRQVLISDLDAQLANPTADFPLSWRVVTPEQAGLHQLSLSAGEQVIHLTLATGDRTLPQLASVDAVGTIKNVTIVYPPKLEKDLVFFRPFAPLGWHWDIGWLGVYLLAYLPAMFIARAALRLP